MEFRKQQQLFSDLGFSAKGLKNEELIKSFVKGDFVAIPFNRDDIAFSGLIRNYMYSYAKYYQSFLPNNKVQIYEDVCKTESVTTNGWGVEVSRYCVEWVKQPTGLFARPELYAAYNVVQSIVDRDALKNFGKMLIQMTEDKSFSSMFDKALDAQSIASDMEQLVLTNGHTKALQRFEVNLIRFAHDESPIELDGTIALRKVDYSKNQSFDRLTRDLIIANSKSWTFTLISNSISNIKVVSRNQEGRPVKITASYQFEGLFGKQKDTVEITFEDGLPDCIFFCELFFHLPHT